MIKKDGSEEEARNNEKVFYLKDGRRRKLNLQPLFRAGLFLGLLTVDCVRNRSWRRSSSRSMGRSRS